MENPFIYDSRQLLVWDTKNSKIPSGQKMYRMNYIRLGRYRPTHKKQKGSKKSV